MRERYLPNQAFHSVWERHEFPIDNKNMLAGPTGMGGVTGNDLRGLIEKFYESLDKVTTAKRLQPAETGGAQYRKILPIREFSGLVGWFL